MGAELNRPSSTPACHIYHQAVIAPRRRGTISHSFHASESMLSPRARTLPLVLLYLTTWAALAAQPSLDAADGSFPALKRLSTELGFTLYYNPKLSEVLGSPHPDSAAMEESGVEIERPLRTQLNGDHQWFTIDCDNGPSADLSCTIFRETPQGLNKVATLGGERFIFPGNGVLYTDGKNDERFDVRRKYTWHDGKLTEVKQPFYYVGLDSRTLVDLDIYSSKDFRQPVAHLPKGTTVTVLLNEVVDKGNDEYDVGNCLVKTPFGLVGWVRSTVDQPPVIDDLLYHGD